MNPAAGDALPQSFPIQPGANLGLQQHLGPLGLHRQSPTRTAEAHLASERGGVGRDLGQGKQNPRRRRLEPAGLDVPDEAPPPVVEQAFDQRPQLSRLHRRRTAKRAASQGDPGLLGGQRFLEESDSFLAFVRAASRRQQIQRGGQALTGAGEIVAQALGEALGQFDRGGVIHIGQ